MGLFEHFPYTNFHDLNLDWILKTVKELYNKVSKQTDWIEEHQKEYEELKKIYDDLYNGTLTPALEASLRNWIDNNLVTLIGDAIKTVHFGLTNDGYFCAFIPSSWSDIQFGTITDSDDPLYGHLTLSYD